MVVVCCAIALPSCVNTAAMTNDPKSLLRVCMAVFLSAMEGLSGMKGQTNTVRAVRRRAALLDHLVGAQNAIDIGGGATPNVYPVDSVGEQAAVSGKGRLRIDRRYVVTVPSHHT